MHTFGVINVVYLNLFWMIVISSCNFCLLDEALLTRVVQSMCSKVIFEVKNQHTRGNEKQNFHLSKSLKGINVYSSSKNTVISK